LTPAFFFAGAAGDMNEVDPDEIPESVYNPLLLTSADTANRRHARPCRSSFGMNPVEAFRA
jgi:hypothetical protein